MKLQAAAEAETGAIELTIGLGAHQMIDAPGGAILEVSAHSGAGVNSKRAWMNYLTIEFRITISYHYIFTHTYENHNLEALRHCNVSQNLWNRLNFKFEILYLPNHAKLNNSSTKNCKIIKPDWNFKSPNDCNEIQKLD